MTTGNRARVVALEIVEDLEAALVEFGAVAASLARGAEDSTAVE